MSNQSFTTTTSLSHSALSSALRAAFALQRTGQLRDAEASFRAILQAQPALPEALHGLSLVLEAAGQPEAAIDTARQAIAAAPENAGLHYTLGLMHDHLGQTTLAAERYREAIRLRSEFREAWNNLGLVLAQQHEFAQAQPCFERVLELQPDHIGARRNLASVLKEHAEALIGQRRLDVARDMLQRALLMAADSADTAWRLAWVHAHMSAPELAIATYRGALERDPTDWRARLGAALTLPIIPTSATALEVSRQNYTTALDDLVQSAQRLPVSDDPATLARQLERDNFYLAYQGENDVELSSRYATLLQSLLARYTADMPALASTMHGRPERLRIGFASAYFHDCTVGHYFRSWITELDGQRFEKFVYALGPTHDELSETIRHSADHHARPTGNILDIARNIRADALDVLVYPELGMHGRTFALAGFRLAPTQCAGWGHPVTSGHPTIDHFLSSALMEPTDGQRHYVEQLVLLPGLGTCYTPPLPSRQKSRPDFGLPADRHLYLSPQSLFKIHPDNDVLLAEMLARDPEGTLIFFDAEYPWLTQAFRRRLDIALAHARVAADRVMFLPLLPRADYLEVNRLCDVMLDTLHWSGGNTTLDALAVGLPVVTQWGRFMRGRQSAGMLTAMGLAELIARDRGDYADIALSIARDRRRRIDLETRILAAQGRLFGDVAPIRHLEDFFLAVADQRRMPASTPGARNSSART
jgi:protein O-GlcNAc transferase